MPQTIAPVTVESDAISRCFRSRIDGWFVSVVAISTIGLIVAVVLTIAKGNWIADGALLVVLGAAGGVVTWVFLRTFYVVTRDRLIARSGPFRWNVPLATIHSLAATHNPLSSPALSMDRIEVRHAAGTLLVSPKDKAGFVAAVRAGAPAVEVRGLP